MLRNVQTPVTADEFFQLPETNLPRELINGEILEITAPELDHQDVVGNIFVFVKGVARQRGGKAYVAPVDVYLDTLNIPQPDVLWVAPDSLCHADGNKRLIGAPDFVAEVLSPSTALKDRREKFALYERFGVREYWIVDPRDQLIEVWILREAAFVRLNVYGLEDTFESPLLGTVNVDELFAG
jgi:Uma2 family endonuclease